MLDRGVVPSCPQCAQTDTVWKVSEFFGFSRNLSDAEFSLPVGIRSAPCSYPLAPLEKQLKPPAKPPIHNYGGCLGIVFQAIIRAMLAGFLLGFCGTYIFSWLRIAEDASLFDIATLITVFSLIPIALWLRRAEARYHQDYPRWQTALAHWRTLYYCCRCAYVFAPGQGRAVPVAEIQTLL